jgi:hypothetical protein
MVVAVIGSRSCNDISFVFSALDEVSKEHPITKIISGGARGADSFGKMWADKYNIPTTIFYPNWVVYGKRAGFMRNIDIIENSEFVLAFWDGVSKGTRHSIEIAKDRKIPFIVLNI